MKATKNVLAVILGSVAAMVLIAIGEFIIGSVFPISAQIDMNNRDAIAAAIKQLPQGAFISLLISYMVASFAGGCVAAWRAKRITIRPSMAVGIILTLAGLYNIFTLPHPAWFAIASLCGYLPCAYAGGKIMQQRIPLLNIE